MADAPLPSPGDDRPAIRDSVNASEAADKPQVGNQARSATLTDDSKSLHVGPVEDGAPANSSPAAATPKDGSTGVHAVPVSEDALANSLPAAVTPKDGSTSIPMGADAPAESSPEAATTEAQSNTGCCPCGSCLDKVWDFFVCVFHFLTLDLFRPFPDDMIHPQTFQQHVELQHLYRHRTIARIKAVSFYIGLGIGIYAFVKFKWPPNIYT